MPWYTAKPFGDHWGWHWTMNHFDPEQITDGRRDIAAPYYPLIGPYDSGDPQVLEYHLLLMKLAGIDGVIVDWYGLTDFRDYAMLHRNTERLVEQLGRLRMKFLICYEDQTIPALVEGNRIQSSQRVAHAKQELEWLAENWFPLESYFKVADQPVLISFGYGGLSNEEWEQCLADDSKTLVYMSEHDRRSVAAGAFDWPIPSRGFEQVQRFAELSKAWTQAIPVAYPRFHDIYAAAGVSEGYPRVEDQDGKMFRETMRLAFASKRSIIQIATWNDWGEGTQIEPSREYGYRDLEFVQRVRRAGIEREFKPVPSDLRIPFHLLQLRREQRASADQLDQVVRLIVENRLPEARKLMGELVRL